MVRPEQVEPLPADARRDGADVVVLERSFLGADVLLTVEMKESVRLRLRCRGEAAGNIELRARICVNLRNAPWVIPEEEP
jgi:hypothetical protein